MSDLGSQKTEKVSFDPGWNDPPPTTYNPQVQKPRNLLNKRVAFPLSTAPTNPVARGVPTLPSTGCPMPMPTQPLVPTMLRPNDNEEVSINSESALIEVSEILNSVLDNSEELASSNKDIRKRIKIMEDSWKNGKFSAQAQHKILKLCLALKENRPHDADVLHKALAVEHAGAVGSWMPAVRKLINCSVARHDLLAIDRDETPDS